MACLVSNSIVVFIGNMNTRRNVARRLGEEVANAGAPPHDEQVPPLEENATVDQATGSPPPITEAEMRASLAQVAYAMTIQAQATTVQANRDISPYPHHKSLLCLHV